MAKIVFQQYGVLAVCIFGSQIKGLAHPLSDLDIGIVFENFLKREKNITEVYTEIHATLKKEFRGKEIDLVFLQEAPISLQFDALASGQFIYISDPAALAAIRERVINKYYDFLPISRIFYETLIKSV